MLRDRDSDGNGTLDERVYTLQNWRTDVVAASGPLPGGVDPAGEIVEQARYNPYGQPLGYGPGDYDLSGSVNSSDFLAFSAEYNAWSSGGAYNPRVDWYNFDNAVNSTDFLNFLTAYTNDTDPRGPGVLSGESVLNRFGYAGYQWDDTIQRYHVRNRVYNPVDGRWSRRDPLGYVDILNLFHYLDSRPINYRDPMGLAACDMEGGSCSGGGGNGQLPPNIDPGGIIIMDGIYRPLDVLTTDCNSSLQWAIQSSFSPDVGQAVPLESILTPLRLVPADPVSTPSPAPGTGIIAPLVMCYLTAHTCYCIGEEISPYVYPDITPGTYFPGMAPIPAASSGANNSACQQAKADQDAKCGGPRVSWKVKFSCGQGMPPSGNQNTQERSRYCRLAWQKLAQARKCMEARIRETVICFGRPNWGHWQQIEQTVRAQQTCLKKLQMYCTTSANLPKAPINPFPQPII